MASNRRGNDWRSQPRGADGQFKERAHIYAPRSEVIRIRVTRAERQLIETAAERADMSMTAYLVQAARRMVPHGSTPQQQEPPLSRHQKQLAKRLHGGRRR